LRKPIELSSEDYSEICSLLDIDSTQDYEVTKYLSKRVSWFKSRITSKALKKRIANKIIFVFGAGPSLDESIKKFIPIFQTFKEKIAIIAADGALLALQENTIPVDAVVTDLDGSLTALKKGLSMSTIVILHAHGDNLSKLKAIEDMIPNIGILGSTQVTSNMKITNFGGFTDGDRAVYLAANFKARKIILFAYDFGTVVGRYSKPEKHEENFSASKRKLVKFSIAKKLLKKAPNLFPQIDFYNATIHGDTIENWKSVSIDDITNLLVI